MISLIASGLAQRRYAFPNLSSASATTVVGTEIQKKIPNTDTQNKDTQNTNAKSKPITVGGTMLRCNVCNSCLGSQHQLICLMLLYEHICSFAHYQHQHHHAVIIVFIINVILLGGNIEGLMAMCSYMPFRNKI